MPEFPRSLSYIWRTYHRLRRRKGSNGFGVSPLEWPDIEAYMRVSRSTLLPWEVELIERIDDVFMVASVRQKPEAS